MPSIVQRIRNDGPNPGNTQLPQGLKTTGDQLFQPGNSVLAWTTCANYGGNHSQTLLTDTEGNTYQKLLLITGDRSSLNTSQVLCLWFCPAVKGGTVPATLWQQFVGGDVDYQAFYALELTPCTVVGTHANVQNAVVIAADAVNSGVTIADLPNDLLIGFAFNVSELSPIYVASPGTGMTLLEDIWPFYEPGGSNVCVAFKSIIAAGNDRATFTPPPGAPDYWQTTCCVLRDSVPVPPSMTIQLTTAQLQAFNEGQPLIIKGG